MTLEQDFYDILYRSRSTFVEEKNYIENFKANSASALFLWSNWCERLCLQLLQRIKSNFGHLQIKPLRLRAVTQLIEKERFRSISKTKTKTKTKMKTKTKTKTKTKMNYKSTRQCVSSGNSI